MRLRLALLLVVLTTPVIAQTPPAASNDAFISPSRPVPVGKAPTMQAKLVKDTPGEQVYSIIFFKDDEVMSGLTDFAIAHKVSDAHFTAIGAVSGATLAWLDIPKKMYRRIAVTQQVEVLSLIGDIAVFNGVPVVHMHAVLCKPDGSTVGGHVFELITNPTVEVFMTVNTTPLTKKADDVSGMKLIDPAH
jgi:predicted DNA-binding protein with PD1-like motif